MCSRSSDLENTIVLRSGRSCSRLAEARDALHLGIAGLDFGDQQIGFVLCDERECALRRLAYQRP